MVAATFYKVELLNGCISVGHSNVFIPSTLNGPCYTAEGSIDEEKIKLNQDTATDVYSDRLSGTTFNGKQIYFTKQVMLRQFTTKADAITFWYSWKEVRSKKQC